jgi:hypothetical protein
MRFVRSPNFFFGVNFNQTAVVQIVAQFPTLPCLWTKPIGCVSTSRVGANRHPINAIFNFNVKMADDFHKDKENLAKLVGKKIKFAALQRLGCRGVDIVTEDNDSFVIGYCNGNPSLSVSFLPAAEYRKTENYKRHFEPESNRK